MKWGLRVSWRYPSETLVTIGFLAIPKPWKKLRESGDSSI